MAKDDAAKLRNRAAPTEAMADRQNKPVTGTARSKPMGFEPMITLLIVSTAMLILPLATYFAIRHYIIDSTTIAAMGSIAVVQIIVAAYIFKAWRDENNEHAAQEKEKMKTR